MTPETTQFLQKAHKLLQDAQVMLDVRLYDAVGRTAYLAAFHTAQAYISELTSRGVKTHKGVHTEFLRLTRNDAGIDPELRAFLSRAYNLKAIADYEIATDQTVSPDQAAQVLQVAQRFVSYFEQALIDRAG